MMMDASIIRGKYIFTKKPVPVRKIITTGMLACQFKPQSRLMVAYKSDAKLLLTLNLQFNNKN
tara:strand:- start:2046 stop:2234 length:189 start_codon:yes stop_codon:yes gene_type:complete